MKIVRLLLLVVACCWLLLVGYAQDSVFRIGLILPLQTANSIEKLDGFSNAHDYYTASRINLDEDAVISLDFMQGAIQALNESPDSFRVELSVYDNRNDDSVTTEILKKWELKKLDIIIGSVSTSTAKLVADYCKQNKIINIQPFTPSKSLTSENPYHLKLAPTIDAHIDAMFNSIVDSFAGSNVIIYSPGSENSLSAAYQFDSLFARYNKTAARKFSVVMLNTKNMTVNGKKTNAVEQLKAGRQNILIITSYEESFINGNLRVLFSDLEKHQITVFGMPTWLRGEILRLDYINDFSSRISDAFFVDTAKPATMSFITQYQDSFYVAPSKYAHLGYDVMNFTLRALDEYGKDFLNHIATQRYSGTGYKFDVVKNFHHKPAQMIPGTAYPGIEPSPAINYFENRHVNVFKVEDYRLQKVW